jgi:very-short-patch-repair endonuclease
LTCAGVLGREELQALIAQAEVLHLPIGNLPGFLHEPTRSELERRFLGLCRRHGLPKPEVNVRIGSYEVDFLWREERVVVETDGWASHGTRSAFEADRARDAELKALGHEVMRFTHRQVWHDGAVAMRRLRSLLIASRASS